MQYCLILLKFKFRTWIHANANPRYSALKVAVTKVKVQYMWLQKLVTSKFFYIQLQILKNPDVAAGASGTKKINFALLAFK